MLPVHLYGDFDYNDVEKIKTICELTSPVVKLIENL